MVQPLPRQADKCIRVLENPSGRSGGIKTLSAARLYRVEKPAIGALLATLTRDRIGSEQSLPFGLTQDTEKKKRRYAVHQKNHERIRANLQGLLFF